jgi:hypothetical protein
MRKTAKEITETNNSEEIHSWLFTATIAELHQFLRLVRTDHSLAVHARDALQIKLSEAVRKPHPLLWCTFGVGVIAAAASVIGYWEQIVAAFRGLLSFVFPGSSR